MKSLTLGSSATLHLVGDKPVIIVVFGTANIDGVIDASAHGATPGPGAERDCSVGTGTNGTDGSGLYISSDGGGGGGFGSAGGNGASSNGMSTRERGWRGRGQPHTRAVARRLPGRRGWIEGWRIQRGGPGRGRRCRADLGFRTDQHRRFGARGRRRRRSQHREPGRRRRRRQRRRGAARGIERRPSTAAR